MCLHRCFVLLQLLVREPYGVVQSFSKVIQPSLLELGYGVSSCSSSSAAISTALLQSCVSAAGRGVRREAPAAAAAHACTLV
jgi:hypothetical protein